MAPAASIASFTGCRDSLSKLALPLAVPPEMSRIVMLFNSQISSNDAQIPLDLQGCSKTQSQLSNLVQKKSYADLLESAPSALDKARMIAQTADHASVHLDILPTPDRTFSSQETTALIKARLGLQIYTHESICGKCKVQVNDTVANHAMCCMSDNDKLGLHNRISGFLAGEHKVAGHTIGFEVTALKLSPHTNDRPGDVTINNYERHINAAIDVTNHTPTAHHNVMGTIHGPRHGTPGGMPNYAAAEAEQEKFSRYSYLNARYIIRPLCFQSTGGWNKITQQMLIKCAQRSCTTRKMSSAKNLKRISEGLAFVHMKGIANAILSHDPQVFGAPPFADDER
jgi:hypothetical protein